MPGASNPQRKGPSGPRNVDIENLTSDTIINSSDVDGSNVSDALDNLLGLGLFGPGSDAPIEASAGTIVLTRDTYPSRIRLTGTAKIETRNYRLRCSGDTDITEAGVDAITPGYTNGGTTLNTTAGVGGAAQPSSNSLIGGGAASNGGSGNSGTGTFGSAPAVGTLAVGFGGVGAQGGGVILANGNHNAPPGPGVITLLLDLPQALGIPLAYNNAGPITFGRGGLGGWGGGTGETSSTVGTTARGGGGGGGPGGVLDFATRTLTTGPNTPAGCINARGGDGGLGGSASTNGSQSSVGGSSGGGGGGGGAVFLVVGRRIGPTVPKLVNANGGRGGNGGNGAGTPVGALGGSAGGSGQSGQITAIEIASDTTTYVPRGSLTAPIESTSITGATSIPVVDNGIDF
jgi:hypothetical protein